MAFLMSAVVIPPPSGHWSFSTPSFATWISSMRGPQILYSSTTIPRTRSKSSEQKEEEDSQWCPLATLLPVCSSSQSSVWRHCDTVTHHQKHRCKWIVLLHHHSVLSSYSINKPTMPGPICNSFMRNWWAVEVCIITKAIPMWAPSLCTLQTSKTWPFIHSYIVVGTVIADGSWYLTCLAQGLQGEPLPLHLMFCSLNTDSTIVQSSGPSLTLLHGTLSSRMRMSRWWPSTRSSRGGMLHSLLSLCTRRHPHLLWHTIYFIFLFYLTSCITTAVTWLTPFTFTIVPVYLWLGLTHYQYAVVTQYWYLLFVDSLWLHYCTLTQDESSTVLWLTMSRLLIVHDSYCWHDSLFSNTISTDVFGP